MGNFFARTFFCLWPNTSKQYFTEEGKRLRCAMLACTCIHTFLFVFSLSLVGFYPMLYNLWLGCWAYSCYLTLREREVIAYFIMLVAVIVVQIGRFWRGNEGSWQSLAGLAEIGVYCLVLYIAARYYYAFRVSGGLHGIAENSKQARKYRGSIQDNSTPKFSMPDTPSEQTQQPLLQNIEKANVDSSLDKKV